MIHEKDYILRLVKQMAALFAAVLGKEKVQDTDVTNLELDDLFEEITGISRDFLTTSQTSTLVTMTGLIPDPNRIVLAACILGKKAEISGCAEYSKAARSLLSNINQDEVLDEVRDICRQFA